MKFTLLYLLVFVITITSCSDKKEVIVDPRLATDSLKVNFQAQKKSEIILTPTAKNAINSWEDFDSLETYINSLDTITLYNLRNMGKDWIKTALNTQKEVKDSLVNSAIKARLTVLYSKTNTLVQEASKLKVDTALVNKEATEFYNSFQNLKLQINLKYQESIEELLEKYEIKADSLSAKRDSIKNAAKDVSKTSVLKREN